MTAPLWSGDSLGTALFWFIT